MIKLDKKNPKNKICCSTTLWFRPLKKQQPLHKKVSCTLQLRYPITEVGRGTFYLDDCPTLR